MDGIQPYAGHAHPAHFSPPEGFGHGGPPSLALAGNGHPSAFGHAAHAGSLGLPAKTVRDYLRSIRRRFWMVVAIGSFLSVVGALVVLRMPAVYRTVAEITIEPPRYDTFLSGIINANALLPHDSDEQLMYVPDKLALLRSKPLIDKIVFDPSITGGKAVNPLDDPAVELIKNLSTRNLIGTHHHTIWLEGRDPAKITRTLSLLLEKFREQTRVESMETLDESKRLAGNNLEKLSEELKRINRRIHTVAVASKVVGPGSMNVPQERLRGVDQALIYRQQSYSDLQRQLKIQSLHPTPGSGRGEARAAKAERLEAEETALLRRYQRAKAITRDASDPNLLHLVREIRQLRADRADLEKPGFEADGGDEQEQILSAARDDIRDLEVQRAELISEMQNSMPAYDEHLDLIAQRELKQKQIAETTKKFADFEAVSRTQKDPVKIIVSPFEPLFPERPKKALYLAAVFLLAVIAGLGSAVGLEHLDHSVKVPEHLTHGLGLPLLGVVPKIKRTAKVHRGGHLWTPGIPDSIEADAYRNIRASLVGVAAKARPIVTLLMTSAKAGEGKSTTALNLAATCARAGERTILVDVDLRRPSLRDVFPNGDDHRGLVDVLRGTLPWQRVVVATDLPNLDFLPTGDASDVPIEILGSLELRQLILSLSQHHYDRVILDGPAILGLADCRLLGRIVDAAVMVVRSGAMEIRPLRRAKAMLEQSHVNLAGVVFNGLADDLENWSSYGPSTTTATVTLAPASAFVRPALAAAGYSS